MSYTREGYSTLTPVIITKDARTTLEGYVKALGVDVRETLNCPKSGNLMHACLKIGDSTIFLGQEAPMQGFVATERQELYLYVANVEDALKKAVNAGWKKMSEPEDMFWGDRIANVQDIDGNTWKLTQAIRDVSTEEVEAAMKVMANA
ncbi:MAG: VOC family protein [Bdellovibrionales bacterium]